MARFALMTFGSLGDVAPCLALGARLVARGHEVVLAAPPWAAARAAAAGIGFRPIGRAMNGPERRFAVLHALAPPSVPEQVRRLSRLSALGADEVLAEAEAVARASDVVVAAVLTPPARVAAERSGAPFVTMAASHASILTDDPGHRAALAPLAEEVDELRRRVGLPAGADEGVSRLFSPRGNLVAVSEVMVEGRAIAPIHRVTGAWFEADAGYAPPPALAAFLDGGEAPVVLGIGSMADRDPAWLTRTLIAALARCGLRGVVLDGWGGIASAVRLPPTMIAAGEVPHAWLLRRARAIFSHGGAGTIAAALRAGIPSVVMPYGMDQPFLADEVVRLGAGVRVDRATLAPVRLAAAFTEAIGSASIARSVAACAARVRAEDGTGRAAEILEGIARAG